MKKHCGGVSYFPRMRELVGHHVDGKKMVYFHVTHSPCCCCMNKDVLTKTLQNYVYWTKFGCYLQNVFFVYNLATHIGHQSDRG